jgi:DNA polymerase-4
VVKLKFEDFQQTTMERAGNTLDRHALQGLLESAWDRGEGKAVRLIGFGVNFEDPVELDELQMTLFDAP